MSRLEFKNLVAWSDDSLKRLGISNLIKSGVVKRFRSGLGGSHTVVTYPPLDSLKAISPERILNQIKPVSDLNLYVHVAFCEFLCPFCHYDTEFSEIGSDESPSMKSYFNALLIEIEQWKERLNASAVGSIYIGGGTPTAASTERLLEIISRLKAFSFASPGFTFCVETSPQTTVSSGGAAKLQALVNAGVNRFSMGIQTFDDRLLRRTRGHSQNDALQALDVVSRLVENINIDLIQDLPGQTDEHIFEDLIQIDRFRPAQVTWYVLRLQSESSWFKRYARSALEFPSTLESVRRSLVIREGMKQLGYIAMPGNRFLRETLYRDEFKEVRAGLKSTLLGMGVSAYSHGWGYMFRNSFSHGYVNGINDYVKRINENGFAIERGYELDETEFAASAYVLGIRTRVDLPRATGPAANYLNAAACLLEKLEKMKLVESDGLGSYSLSEAGSLFEEEICALFYSDAVKSELELESDSPAALFQIGHNQAFDSQAKRRAIDKASPYVTRS